MTQLIENPFIQNNTNNYYDDIINIKSNIIQNNIINNYNELFVLIKKNKNNLPIEIYNNYIDKDLFLSISSRFMLYKISLDALQEKYFLDNFIIMNNEEANIYNILEYDLQDKNLIIPILNISFHDLKIFMTQYNNEYSLDNLYNYVLISKYFNYKSQYNIINIISNLKESKIWKKHNIITTFNNLFMYRNFKNNQNNICKFDNNHTLIVNTNHNTCIDVSPVFKKTNSIINYSNLSKNNFTEMFFELNNENQYILFSNLCISTKCDFVLNNYRILNHMKSIISNYANLFRYLFSYAWIVLYYKECNTKLNLDEILFDIDTASLLPVYPIDYSRPKLNPYMPILVNDNVLNPLNNFCGIADYNDIEGDNNFINKGICSLSDFMFRLNIFCTGRNNYNIFENINFKEFNSYIIGSTITACIQKYHPLMSKFLDPSETKSYQIIDGLTNYYDEYYSDAHIDIVSNILEEVDFIKSVYKMYNIISNTINNKFNTKSNYVKTSIKLMKSAVFIIPYNDIIKQLNIISDSENSISYIKKNFNSQEIQFIIKELYAIETKKYYNNIIKNLSDDEINKLQIECPDLFIFDSKCKTYIKSNVSEVSLMYIYKYIITSSELSRDIIITKDTNILYKISKEFYLPCVRSYYDGNTVYLTPSCISAHLTYMNLDYKQSNTNKPMTEILNKYRLRGYGTWLNHLEKDNIHNYSKNTSKWNNLYELYENNKFKSLSTSMFGPIELNNRFTYPKLYNIKYESKSNNIDFSNRYATNILTTSLHNNKIKILHKIISKKFSCDSINIDFDYFTAIDNKGNINIVDDWLIIFLWKISNTSNTSNTSNKCS